MTLLSPPEWTDQEWDDLWVACLDYANATAGNSPGGLVSDPLKMFDAVRGRRVLALASVDYITVYALQSPWLGYGTVFTELLLLKRQGGDSRMFDMHEQAVVAKAKELGACAMTSTIPRQGRKGSGRKRRTQGYSLYSTDMIKEL